MNAIDYPTWLHIIGDWQTLITGILAVIAAAASIWMIRHQMSQVAEIEAERLRRRYLAARATLPATLNTIMGYAQVAIEGLQHIYGDVSDSGEYPARSDGFASLSTRPIYVAPQPPPDMIAAVERIIEASNDHAVADVLADILNRAQVLNSNLHDLPRMLASSTLMVRTNIDGYLVQAARIYAEAESLFPFARREAETVSKPATWEDVERALFLMHIEREDYPDPYELIQRKKATATA